MDQTFSPSPRLSKTQRPFRTGLKKPVRVGLNHQFVVPKKTSKQAQELINWTKADKYMDKTKTPYRRHRCGVGQTPSEG